MDWDPWRWTQHAAEDSWAGVQADTGYPPDVLEDTFHKVFVHLEPGRQRSLQDKEAYFFLAYVYVHLYPQDNQSKRVMWSRKLSNQAGNGICADTLNKVIKR